MTASHHYGIPRANVAYKRQASFLCIACGIIVSKF